MTGESAVVKLEIFTLLIFAVRFKLHGLFFSDSLKFLACNFSCVKICACARDYVLCDRLVSVFLLVGRSLVISLLFFQIFIVTNRLNFKYLFFLFFFLLLGSCLRFLFIFL